MPKEVCVLAYVNLRVCLPSGCVCPSNPACALNGPPPPGVICNLLKGWPKFPREPDFLFQEGSPHPRGRELRASLSQLAEHWRDRPRSGAQTPRQLRAGFIHKPECVCVYSLCVSAVHPH